jgi:hypothetical protein
MRMRSPLDTFLNMELHDPFFEGIGAPSNSWRRGINRQILIDVVEVRAPTSLCAHYDTERRWASSATT